MIGFCGYVKVFVDIRYMVTMLVVCNDCYAFISDWQDSSEPVETLFSWFIKHVKHIFDFCCCLVYFSCII